VALHTPLSRTRTVDTVGLATWPNKVDWDRTDFRICHPAALDFFEEFWVLSSLDYRLVPLSQGTVTATPDQSPPPRIGALVTIVVLAGGVSHAGSAENR
jgi:hypothetical protein